MIGDIDDRAIVRNRLAAFIGPGRNPIEDRARLHLVAAQPGCQVDRPDPHQILAVIAALLHDRRGGRVEVHRQRRQRFRHQEIVREHVAVAGIDRIDRRIDLGHASDQLVRQRAGIERDPRERVEGIVLRRLTRTAGRNQQHARIVENGERRILRQREIDLLMLGTADDGQPIGQLLGDLRIELRRFDLDALILAADERAVERDVERLAGGGVQHGVGRHAKDLVAQRRRHDDVGAAVLVPQAGREQIILRPAIAAEIAVGGRRRRDDACAKAIVAGDRAIGVERPADQPERSDIARHIQPFLGIGLLGDDVDRPAQIVATQQDRVGTFQHLDPLDSRERQRRARGEHRSGRRWQAVDRAVGIEPAHGEADAALHGRAVHDDAAGIAQRFGQGLCLLPLQQLGGDDLRVARLIAQRLAEARGAGRPAHQHAGFRLVRPGDDDDVVQDGDDARVIDVDRHRQPARRLRDRIALRLRILHRACGQPADRVRIDVQR